MVVKKNDGYSRMEWLPGWNTIESAGWWSDFYFRLGIICLILLAVTEVLSHYYGSRKDELVAAAESLAQKNHDVETKQVRQQLADAQKQIEATTKDAEQLQYRIAQRVLNEEQKKELITVLAPFRGQKVSIQSVMGDGDGDRFKNDFVAVLDTAGWDHNGPAGISQAVIMPSPVGVQVTMNDTEAHAGRVLKSAEMFVLTLHRLGITSSNTIFINPSVPVGMINLIIGNKP